MGRILIVGSQNIIALNIPRLSKHEIDFASRRRLGQRVMTGISRIWKPLRGVNISVGPLQAYDLVHSFNAIPITRRPWVITFESTLPRTIGPLGQSFGRMLRHQLLDPQCRQLIALSNYALGKLRKANRSWPDLNNVIAKTRVIAPAVSITWGTVKKIVPAKPLQVIFVGNDFARKGGIVLLRVAEAALARRLPIRFHVVSAMRYAGNIYTDAARRNHYAEDLRLLSLENVTFHGRLKHRDVIGLLAQSHVQLMATVDDTYGFSVLEGYSVGVPAITTNVCALPEFVHDGRTGYLLKVQRDQWRNWRHLDKRDWHRLTELYDDLAEQALLRLECFLDKDILERTSHAALEYARAHHETSRQAADLDRLYSVAIGETADAGEATA